MNVYRTVGKSPCGTHLEGFSEPGRQSTPMPNSLTPKMAPVSHHVLFMELMDSCILINDCTGEFKYHLTRGNLSNPRSTIVSSLAKSKASVDSDQ